MKNIKLYNTAKKRKATANESAKWLIIELADRMCALQEQFGFEDLNDDEADEVLRHFDKHLKSLRERFNVWDIEIRL